MVDTGPQLGLQTASSLPFGLPLVRKLGLHGSKIAWYPPTQNKANLGHLKPDGFPSSFIVPLPQVESWTKFRIQNNGLERLRPGPFLPVDELALAVDPGRIHIAAACTGHE